MLRIKPLCHFGMNGINMWVPCQSEPITIQCDLYVGELSGDFGLNFRFRSNFEFLISMQWISCRCNYKPFATHISILEIWKLRNMILNGSASSVISKQKDVWVFLKRIAKIAYKSFDLAISVESIRSDRRTIQLIHKNKRQNKTKTQKKCVSDVGSRNEMSCVYLPNFVLLLDSH